MKFPTPPKCCQCDRPTVYCCDAKLRSHHSGAVIVCGVGVCEEHVTRLSGEARDRYLGAKVIRSSEDALDLCPQHRDEQVKKLGWPGKKAKT